jgi:membrane protease subunit HflC
MKRPLTIVVGIVLLVVLILFSMTYTVSFHEVAIRSRFGQTDDASIVRDPGLHFRLPFFADAVTLIDTRMQVRQSPLVMLQTADGQQVVVRTYVLWNVRTEGSGPLDFFRSYGSMDAAQTAIDGQFRDALSALSGYEFDQLTGEDNVLDEAEEAVLKRMASLQQSGIDPQTVGISRLLLPPKTTTAVLERMQARRDTLAENERAQGLADAEAIRADARAKRDKITAFATQRAEEIRAEGEAQAAEYLRQMGQDEELAVFLTWLDAIERALADNTTVILETNTAPWHLLDLHTPLDAGGIPQPSSSSETSR